MRLYLSSFRLGDHPEHLVRLVNRPGARVAVIANAIDVEANPAFVGTRVDSVQGEIDALAGLGLVADELDLRDFSGDRDGLTQALAGYQAVWVRGGNTFVLLHAMRNCGADQVLRDLVLADRIVYAGYSAGACVLAPSLRGLELCDEPSLVESGLGGTISWDGLGLLDYAFVPHLESPGHPETELVALVAQYYRKRAIPFRGLRDGQALVIEGGSTTLV